MRRNRARKNADKSERGSLLRFAILVGLAAWAFRSFVFAPFNIPSGSMLPTLMSGDYVAVAKWPYGVSKYSFPLQFPPIDGRLFGSLPDRGDVVVFVPPGEEDTDFVKRVIGLPGDRIEVRNGRVLLNGKLLQRTAAQPFDLPVSANNPCRRITDSGITADEAASSCTFARFRETLPNGVSYPVLDQVEGSPGDNLSPTLVPAGHLFLMGDNRDDSLDSRFSVPEGGIGFVPLENVVGRASAIFWSTDGSASYLKPWTWFSALRSDRIGNGFGSAE